MKISAVKEILDHYDTDKGLGRAVKEEPHIKELRDFYESLSKSNDRDLSPSELHQLVLIGLGKKSSNKSASCQAFDKLFDYLGDKEVFILLKQSSLLNKDTVSDTVSMKDTPHAFELIRLFARNAQLDASILHQLCPIERVAAAHLYKNLLELEKQQLFTPQNIQGCLKFALHSTAISNLTSFFFTLSLIEQINQVQLNHLFDHFDTIKNGTGYQRIMEYIIAAHWNLNDYVLLIIKNGGRPEIGKALDRISEINQWSDAQKELLVATVLANPQWYERIFDGVKSLSTVNKGYFDTVVSQPEYADKIAQGVELLCAVLPLSTQVRKDFDAYVRKKPQDAETLIEVIQCLRDHSLFNQRSFCDLLSKNLELRTCLSIMRVLSTAELLKENLNLLLTTSNKDLMQIYSGCSGLAGCSQLNQKTFEQLFENLSRDDLQLPIDRSDLFDDAQSPGLGRDSNSFFGGSRSGDGEDNYTILPNLI